LREDCIYYVLHLTTIRSINDDNNFDTLLVCGVSYTNALAKKSPTYCGTIFYWEGSIQGWKEL